MKLAPKSITALFFFVATVYVMRNGNHSFMSPLTKSNLRNLAATTYSYARPSSSTCDGVSLSASFSSADVDRANNLQKSLKSNRGGNPFQDMLEKGNVSSDSFIDYIKGLIAGLAVWAAFFVISLVLCCCAVCNWCCMFGCCKNCKCCRCCKAPEGTKRKRVYMITSLIFMVGLFSAGIAGAVYSGNVSKGMKVAYCNAFNFVEDFAYGVKSAKWLGLAGVSQSLFALSSDITSVASQLGAITGPTQSKYDAVVTALGGVDTDVSGGTWTVDRMDPAVGGTYTPDFFSAASPKGTSGTTTNLIFTEVDKKYKGVADVLTDINPALDDVKNKAADIKTALDDGKQTADDIFKNLDNTIDSLNGNGKTLNDVIDAVSKAILGIFIAYIIIALLPIASILLIVFLKIKFFSKILHVSWCLMGILAILGFLVSAIFYPISVFFVEACGVLTSSVSDEAFFQKTLQNALASISQDAADLSFVCMFGDGNALEQLKLTEQIGYFNTIYDQLDVTALIPDVTLDTANSKIPTKTYLKADELLDKYKTGEVSDSASITTDLDKLNSYTSSTVSGACVTTIQDTWALNSKNCPGPATYDGTGAKERYGSVSCIGEDKFGQNSFTGAQRYDDANIFSTCGAVTFGGSSQPREAYVRAFVDKIKTHHDDINARVNTFTGLNWDNSLKTALNDFETDIYQPFKKLDDVKTALQVVDDSLRGPSDGLIVNTNCQFIGTDMRSFTVALCYGFVTSIFQSVVVLIVVSMFSFFGSICVFCLAKRILNEDGGFTKGG